MANPDKYIPNYSYSSWQASNPTRPLPANEVDGDLADIATSISEIVDAILDVRRSDGFLKNGIVTFDSLSPDVADQIGVGLAAAVAAVDADRVAAEAAVAASQGFSVTSGVSASASSGYATAASASAAAALASANAAAAASVGLKFATNAVAATTANITLSAAQTIDGVSVVAGNRVLVKAQTTASQNGVYVCAVGSWTRDTDADTWAELLSYVISVTSGTTNGGSTWISTAAGGGTIDVTSLTFNSFNTALTDGSVSTAKLADAAVTNVKIAAMAANTIKMNATGSSASPTDFAVVASRLVGRDNASNIVGIAVSAEFSLSSSTLGLATAGIANAKLANMAANSLKANATTGSAVSTDLTIAASRLVGRDDASNIIGIAPSSDLSLTGGVLGVTSGTTPNKLVRLNASSQLPAVDGSLLTGIVASLPRAVSGSVSSPVTVDFTTNYEYELLLSGISANTTANLTIAFSSNGGGSYSSSASAASVKKILNATLSDDTTGTAHVASVDNAGSLYGSIRLWQDLVSGEIAYSYNLHNNYSGATNARAFIGGGTVAMTAAVNRLQFDVPGASFGGGKVTAIPKALR